MKKKDNLEYYYPLSCVDDLGPENKDVAFLLAETEKYPSIRNIGVIGPYGSGKSSVVHSFIKLKDKKYKHTLFFSQETLAEHINKKKRADGSGDKGETDDELFKKAIYLELLKYDTKSILLNKYLDSIVHLKIFRIIRFVVYCLLCLGICFSAFWLLHFVLSKDLVFSIAASSSAFLLLLAVYLFFYVRKLSLTIGFKGSKAESELIAKNNVEAIYQQIEKHPTKLDNLILYILQKNHIKYFVIEDLERLNDKDATLYNKNDVNAIEIIKHFKMLSDLIERSKIVKNRIVFVYGLNEECFDNSEIRSKFFDLIVPIIPVSTYTSAAQAMLKNPTISSLVDKEQIKKSTINKISLFFINQRQINSLLSQFYLAHNKLSDSFDREQLFAMCSLMVLFPKFSHQLFNKDNDLDSLINNEWTIDEQGIGAFSSSRATFPKDVKGNLAKFLKMCINDKYITKGYRYCLTLHNVADDKILTPHDLDLLTMFYGGVDIRQKEFDNPLVVLYRDENDGLYTNIETIHPQIVNCLLTTGDKKRLDRFRAIIDTSNVDKCSKVLASIIEYGDEITINALCLVFVDRLAVCKSIALVKEEKKGLLSYCVLNNYSNNFLVNHESELKDFYAIINSKTFVEKYAFTLKNIEKVINSSRFCPESIKSLCEADKSISQLFKANMKFELSFENICSVFPEFKDKPFAVLSQNQELCTKLLSNVDKAICILEMCGKYDEQSSILLFLRKNSSNGGATILLSSKFFEHWTFKIAVEELRRTGPLPSNIMASLLGLNLLDLNSAYVNYFSSNDPNSFDAHLKNSLELIIKHNYRFDELLSLHLIRLLEKEQLSKITNLLNCNSVPSNLSSIDSEKLIVIFPSLQEDSKESVIATLLSTNKDLIKELLSSGLINQKLLSKFTLPSDILAYIFDNNLKQYYSVSLSDNNKQSFSELINDESTMRKDFAKLIFDEKGSLVSGICIESLVLVCEKEIDNDGCLIKVLNEADKAYFSNDTWLDFIKLYVKKHGNTDSYGKHSLTNNKVGEAIYQCFLTSGLIYEAKGTGKNKLYFKFKK